MFDSEYSVWTGADDKAINSVICFQAFIVIRIISLMKIPIMTRKMKVNRMDASERQ